MIVYDFLLLDQNICDYIQSKLMSFAREQKRLNQQLVFNPPPGYYDIPGQSNARKIASFGQSQRFQWSLNNEAPGPGAYHNNQKDIVRKRLIDESQRRELRDNDPSTSNNIKISSIPSIPKKSATRVYEQLAPGILILHEQQYENSSIGPGSYNITDKLTHPKGITHKIPPERKKKVVEEEPTEVNIPTVAEEIRNQRRMIMHKQNLIKSSTVNKSEINPSDLCLEVIILREKLLRSDENPPPGYYHSDYISDFKPADEKKGENQALGGKEKRFQGSLPKSNQDLGPGKYTIQQQGNQKGGFIPKQPRKFHPQSQDKPGPGAYITVKAKPKTQIKGNYPPIFGSGINRFPSAPKKIESNPTPGPGSYQIDKRKNKKQKYIKIRKQLLQSGREDYFTEPLTGIQNDLSKISQPGSVKERKFYQYDKNTSNFASKVERFESDKNIMDRMGPGNYNSFDGSFNSKSFNRRPEGYVGDRNMRFDQTEIRPKIGPGTYNPGYETVKQKKIKNVVL